MIIKKIFNNNSILAMDSKKREIVLIGSGIGFKKNIGENITEESVEKVFILKEKDASEKFKLLLEHINPDYVSLCYDIVDYAKNILDTELSDYIYVTLTDHINSTIELYEEGIIKPNILIWEVKRFYSKEFKVGLKALEFIEDEIGVELNEDDACSIALHLINAQINKKYCKVDDIYNITKKIKEILNIVKYTYNISLDENSISYDRFVTHLKFFFKRLENEMEYEEEDDFLLGQVKTKYRMAYDCMLKVEKYLNVELKGDEQLYLTLHIQRVTQK